MKFIIVSIGHTAAGKTTTLRKISNKYGYSFISEGAIKRSLVGESFDVYNSMDENLRSKGYKIAIEQAFNVLEKEQFVVLDASFHQQFRRQWIYEEIKKRNIDCSVIWIYCYCNNKKIVKERIRKRAEAKVVTADIQARSMKVYEYTMETFDEVLIDNFDKDIKTAVIYNNTEKRIIDKIESNNKQIESLAKDISNCFYSHKIYFVRHSVSYFNEQKIYAGNLDIPLSKKGICDSVEIGKRFKKRFPKANIDIVITSSLSRAIETASVMISELRIPKVPIIVKPNQVDEAKKRNLTPFLQFEELNERDYGVLQYLSEKTIQEKYDPQTLKKWRRSFFDGPENGESFDQIVSRTAKVFFNYIKPLSQNNDILVVCHQNTLRALYYLLYNIPRKDIGKIEFNNSEFFVFDSDLEQENIIKNNALIMASGKGRRMKELTNSIPKPLLDVNGKELISYQLEYFKRHNYNISITYSHLKNVWCDFIKKNHEVTFVYTNPDFIYWQCMLEGYKNTKVKSNYFILIAADLVFDYSIIEKALENHIIENNAITVALNSKNGKWKKWKYVFNPEGNITDILIENTVQSNERFFMIVNKEELDKFAAENDNGNLEKENEYGSGANYIIKKMLNLGTKISCIEFNDAFILNVNNQEDLDRAKFFFTLNENDND